MSVILINPFAVAVSAVVTVSKPAGKGNDGAEITASSRTFTAFDFGAASPDRQIFCGVQINDTAGTPEVSSMTIGGVSGTLIARSSINGNSRVELWAAAVPTGTSGDIAFTLSESVAGLGCCIWIVTGAALSAYDTDEDVDDSDPMTGSIDCVAGGAIFGVNGVRSSSGYAVAWGNVIDNEYAAYTAGTGTSRRGAGVAEAFATAQTGLTVQANQSGTGIADPSTLWVAVSPA